MIKTIVVLGGGSAGFMAALALKTKLPSLDVRVVRSPEIGVIGVGEGTTPAFPNFLFDFLKVPRREFYAAAEPTWKLAIKFLWGPRREFYYTFAPEYEQTWPELRRPSGYYHDHETHWVGPTSALMAHDKAFPRNADGSPQIQTPHAFHIENLKLVAWLEGHAQKIGVVIEDGNVTGVETGPVRTTGREEKGIQSMILADGRRVAADLFVDASGFRSELLGRGLEEPYISFERSLFCDRAVIGGWNRTTEVIKPYTVAETMDAGWAWQIEHETFINRGYVYSSSHMDDETARAELLRKNPSIPEDRTRVVKYRSGRRSRNWVGNVVGIGNSAGFVEPLEATALGKIVLECVNLAEMLAETGQRPGPVMVDIYNHFHAEKWDDIRDFLAVHYAFNTRSDTPFWRDCREKTELGGAARLVDYYKENGPSTLARGILLNETNSFGFGGYYAMLVGQKVPYSRDHKPPASEMKLWHERVATLGTGAQSGLSVAETLRALRKIGWIK